MATYNEEQFKFPPKPIAAARVTTFFLILFFAWQGYSKFTGNTSDYNPNLICGDASQTEIHHENDSITHFEVTLIEGCWSGEIYVPNSWNYVYGIRPFGDQNSYWLALWFTGSNPMGPLGAKGNPISLSLRKPFRVQGHGRLIIYSSQR